MDGLNRASAGALSQPCGNDPFRKKTCRVEFLKCCYGALPLAPRKDEAPPFDRVSPTFLPSVVQAG